VTAKLRVLITADAVGGVWQYATDLAQGLAALGIETVLAILGPSPKPAQAKAIARVEGVTLIDTGLPLDWLAASPAEVKEAGAAISALGDKHHADVVQLNAPALAADIMFKAPVVAVAHSCVATWWEAVKGTEIDPDFRWRAELHGNGLRAVQVAVAPSAAFAEATRRAYALERAPVAVHNGRSPLPLPRVAPHDFAFTAGRLWDKGKNAATLDRAAASLPVPLYAIGPTTGPNGDAIELHHAHVLGSRSEKEIGRWLAARPPAARSSSPTSRPSANSGTAPPPSSIRWTRQASPPPSRASSATTWHAWRSATPPRSAPPATRRPPWLERWPTSIAASPTPTPGAGSRRRHEDRLLHPLARKLLEPRQRPFPARRPARADRAGP
jgi:hypothetical protein